MPKIYKAKNSEHILLKLLLLISLGLFITAISTPVMTITKLLFITSSFSIVSGLKDLLVQQQYLLFVLIGLLSIVLPLFKIALLAWVLQVKSSANLDKIIGIIHDHGRWAMLDVMVVALLLVAVKLGAIASVKVHFGLYFFAASILLTMWVTHRTVKILESRKEKNG
jgi:paraquat-inducible protein A